MQDLFKNNLYLSKEWADFMNSLVGNIEFIEHKNNKIYYNSKTNKVIGLHNYSNEEINKLNFNKIRVRSIVNDSNSKLNYQVIPKNTYEIIKNNYKKSFRKSLNHAKENDLEIIKNPNKEELYQIYYNSIKRLNSFHFSQETFNKFLSQQFSRYFGINYKDNLIAGMIFWENKDNVYSSIAFSNKNYWYLNPNNFRLDYLIKYACENSKNIHLGIGFEGSGYEKFKESIGTIKLKCISSPKEFGLNLASKLNGLPLSPVYKYLSEKHERRIIELLMPF